MESLGNKIRRRRVRAALTMQELAEKVELSRGMISYIENDLVIPSDAAAERLETALEAHAGEFVRQCHVQRTEDDVRSLIPPKLIEHFISTGERTL